MQNYVGQPQTVQVPNYAGVNIQIINPSVSVPGAGAPVYNVNSPTYQTSPNGGCYPSSYYTNQWGAPQQAQVAYPSTPFNESSMYPSGTVIGPDGTQCVIGTSNGNGVNGANNGYVQNGNGVNGVNNGYVQNGNGANGVNNGYVPNGNGANGVNNGYAPNGNGANGVNNGYAPNGNGVNGVNNGYVPNGNGVNGATSNNSNSTSSETSITEKKDDVKTEKRAIVQLTDDYIRTLENYLNSQDKEIRLLGAKEVVARLTEDESRKDDKALNALINKMLQDPSQSVKILALSMLNSRNVTGDDTTVKLLQNMQKSSSDYGNNSFLASDILLKMAGKTVEKEFAVKPDASKDKKTETKKVA